MSSKIKSGKDKRDIGRTSGVDRRLCGQQFRKRERLTRENESRVATKREIEREENKHRGQLGTKMLLIIVMMPSSTSDEVT